MPDFYNQCLSVGRRSHIINTCLGAQKSPHFIDFDFERLISLSFELKYTSCYAPSASSGSFNCSFEKKKFWHPCRKKIFWEGGGTFPKIAINLRETTLISSVQTDRQTDTHTHRVPVTFILRTIIIITTLQHLNFIKVFK